VNELVVKALCRRIGDRYGCDRKAAIAAGVSAGVWSHYCSDEHPDTTIPFHRLQRVANAAERRLFAELLIGDGETKAEAEPGDILTQTARATVSAAAVLDEAEKAIGDGNVTPLENRRIRERALDAIQRLQAVLTATDPALKAV
jgi:hypothetical protein